MGLYYYLWQRTIKKRSISSEVCNFFSFSHLPSTGAISLGYSFLLVFGTTCDFLSLRVNKYCCCSLLLFLSHFSDRPREQNMCDLRPARRTGGLLAWCLVTGFLAKSHVFSGNQPATSSRQQNWRQKLKIENDLQ